MKGHKDCTKTPIAWSLVIVPAMLFAGFGIGYITNDFTILQRHASSVHENLSRLILDNNKQLNLSTEILKKDNVELKKSIGLIERLTGKINGTLHVIGTKTEGLESLMKDVANKQRYLENKTENKFISLDESMKGMRDEHHGMQNLTETLISSLKDVKEKQADIESKGNQLEESMNDLNAKQSGLKRELEDHRNRPHGFDKSRKNNEPSNAVRRTDNIILTTAMLLFSLYYK